MEMLTDLRSFFNDIRRRYFPRKEQAIEPASGLPDGLDGSTLNNIVLENFGSRPTATAYVHLSGWKSSGAFRLLIETRDGQSLRLIYKNALYMPEHIPALVDLPLRPGPPEYSMFTQATGPLANYLPKAYLVEELQPSLHYRYVLEDLSEEYRRAYTHDDILHACRLLPGLYQALNVWANSANTQDLLRYDQKAILALDTYARNSLENYYQKNDDSVLKEVLTLWPEISRIHTSDAFFAMQSQCVIHGDTNFTNVHLHKSDPEQMKLVDWEWAGFGFPFSDLASLLKGTPSYLEKIAYSRITNHRSEAAHCFNTTLSIDENARLYQWSRLDRGLLDAAFLAAQCLNAIPSQMTAFSLPNAVTHALRRVLSAYQQLAG